MKEVWKDIPGYEGLYWVSNMGNIRSKRTILKPQINTGGYKKVVLHKNNVPKNFLVHRIVAMVFVANPNNRPEVDHINTLRTDTRASNLRWVNRRENNLNPITNKRMSESAKYSHNKPIIQYDLEGNIVAEYPSTMEAYRKTGVHFANIRACTTHKRQQMGGFVWRFKGDPFIRPKSKRVREINQYDKDGRLIKTWPSILSAASTLGMNNTNSLIKCLKGANRTCKGYKWKYKDD